MMRGRQDNLDTRFSAMKQENEALWREIAVLRQKHMKQQQIVNKLIQFLVTIVQPQRTGLGGMGGKRRFQLMINDTPQSSSKMRRPNESEGRGPIIHELSEELLDDVADANDLGMDLSPAMSVEEMSPESTSASSPNKLSSGGQQTLNEDIIDAMQYPNYYRNVVGSNDGQAEEGTADGGGGGGGSGENSNQSETTTTNQNNLNYIEDLNDELNVFDEANVLTTPMARREMEKSQNIKRIQEAQAATRIAAENSRGARSRNGKYQKVVKAAKKEEKSRRKEQQQADVSVDVEGDGEQENENLFEAVNIKMEKMPMYANQEDFMSDEIPSDLFDDENSIQDHPDSSPMIGGINLATNPYPQHQAAIQVTPGTSTNADKGMATTADAAGVSETGASSQSNKDDWALSTTGKPDDVFKLSTP